MQGTLQVRPCKLDGAIHGANAPARLTRPAPDRFLRAASQGVKKEKQKRVASLRLLGAEHGSALQKHSFRNICS